ncbi:hypothetical protein B7494_g3879 [Chlorociboria aeruginascens]|nr:hypothetical protein B7494_g3879 [Chlorociboria aeruginascens]
MRIVLETPAHSSRILLLSSWVAITTAIAPPSIWTVDIDNSPAPSPEDGPPASFHASRNPALLPAQIGAIVSAYVLSVLIIGSAILWIGRRLRRETNVPAKPSDVEMVTTLAKGFNFDPSPISPRSQPHPHSRNFSWPSPTEKDRNPYIFPPSTRAPPAESHPSIDTRVVTADQEMAQQDLEAIYAHVMEQEAAKAQGIILKEIPLPLRAQNGPAPLPSESPQRQNTPPKKAERSKTKPLSIETDETKVVGRRQSFASSLISSIKSPRSPRKKGLKGLVISSPVSSTGSVPWSGNASDEEPLSPRYYSPPPPPPVPQDQAPPHSPLQQTHTRNDSSTSIPLSIAERISTPRSQHPPVSFRDPQQPQPQPQSPQSASAESLPPRTPSILPPPPQTISKNWPLPLHDLKPQLQSHHPGALLHHLVTSSPLPSTRAAWRLSLLLALDENHDFGADQHQQWA